MQSIGLAMKGADGRSYTFRTSDKDPKRILPPEWGDTVPARLFQDSTTANHPGVGVRGAAARGGGGRPPHDAALRVHARRPRARASSARPSAASPARSRSTRCPDRTARPASRARPRSSRRGSSGSSSSPARRASTTARSCARGSSTSGSRTGTATTSSGAGCGAARTRPSSRCPRTATRPSRASAACCSRRRARTHPKFMDFHDSLRELRGLDDAGRRGGPLAALGRGPRRLRGDRQGAGGPADGRGRGRSRRGACRPSGTRSTAPRLRRGAQEAPRRAGAGGARVLRAPRLARWTFMRRISPTRCG